MLKSVKGLPRYEHMHYRDQEEHAFEERYCAGKNLDVFPRSAYIVNIGCIYQPYLAWVSRFVLMAFPRRSRASSSCTPMTRHHLHHHSRFLGLTPQCSGRYESMHRRSRAHWTPLAQRISIF